MQIDRILAICGLCGGPLLLLVAYSKDLPVGLPIVVITSCIVYLVLSGKWCKGSPLLEPEAEPLVPRNKGDARAVHSPAWFAATNAFFMILYLLSVVDLYHSLYHRSVQYFVIMALLSALVSFDIMSIDYESTPSLSFISLSKILLISANLGIGRYTLFPSLVGDDPFKHAVWTQMTLESGNVPLNTPYTAFPNFHIEAAVLSMVTALPTLKTTLFFASGLLSIVSLVVIFKLARVFLDTRSSLLATLFASATTWLVQSRVEMLPYLTGLSLFPFILYFTITRDRLRFRGLVFFILFSSLVLTHTLSSFVTLFCMGAFLFGWRLVRPLRQGQLHTLLYSLIFLISYWFFASTFSVFAIRNIVETLTHPTALGFPLHFLSWGESDLSWLGTYIIYWFAILGCLAYLSRKRRTAQRLALVISVLGLFGISYGFMVALSSWAVVPDRWFPFGLTLAVIPASYAIISLAKQSEKRSKALFICILVFVLVFFSITSSFANDDFPILTRAVTVNSLTSAELQSATLLNAVREGPITTDGYYAQDLFNQTLNHGHLGENDLTILQTGMLEGSSPVEGLVIIRASGFLFPVTIETGGTYTSGIYSPYFYVSKTYDHSFVQQMVSRGNVVYNSQSVIAIVILQ